MTRKFNIYNNFMMLPAIFVYCVFFILPSIIGIFYSFTSWRPDTDVIKFVGFDNFGRIFSDRVYLTCIKNTVLYAIITVVGKNLFGLILAIALNNKRMKSVNALRTVYYAPSVLSTIVIGQIFIGMLHPEGPVNKLLKGIGLDFLALNWLVDRNIVIFSVSTVAIWAWTGFHMAIYLAGLNSIPQEYYEASRIDGAGPVRIFLKVTLPLMLPSINVNILLSLISGLKVFTEVLILTGGGPGFASEVVLTRIFQAFGEGSWGVGTALNTLLFIVISIVSIPLLIKLRKQEVEI